MADRRNWITAIAYSRAALLKRNAGPPITPLLPKIDILLHPLKVKIESSSTMYLVAVLGAIIAFGATIYTIVQINVDLAAKLEERHDRWLDHLREHVASDSAKGRYLNLLMRDQVPLGGIDLSCKTNGVWNEKAGCTNPVIFSDVDFTENGLQQQSLWNRLFGNGDSNQNYVENINFGDAVFMRGRFNGVSLSGNNFDGANFSGGDFRGASLSFFGNAKIGFSDLTNAIINSRAGLQIFDSNISNSAWHYDADNAQFQNNMPMSVRNWYWADHPPRIAIRTDAIGRAVADNIAAMFFEQSYLCDPAYRGQSFEFLARAERIQFRPAWDERRKKDQAYDNQAECVTMDFATAARNYPSAYKPVYVSFKPQQ
ncbi:pentapeptide repeat-containing protein [Rhizobium ruizarguesonis]|uniref:pentapeptide repeat-containing protein n=1 Tax=Rhizobium ruizarguesonis TaxID=2081791 RepID=UPI001CF14C1B|nr:pentapeptide repeat-containing protein [Rhizobium ruizarguesonis]MCB2399358.1 pentapeptide repeat-containing protein [Rhizobium ruizarguesonis]